MQQLRKFSIPHDVIAFVEFCCSLICDSVSMSGPPAIILKLSYNQQVRRFSISDSWFHTITTVSQVVAKPSPSATTGIGPWHRLMQLLQTAYQIPASDIDKLFVYLEDDDFQVPITNDHELRKCVEIDQSTKPAAGGKTLKLFISHDAPSPNSGPPPVVVRATSSGPSDHGAASTDEKAEQSSLFTPKNGAGSRRNSSDASAGGKRPATEEEEGRSQLTGAVSINDSLESDYFKLASPPKPSTAPAPLAPVATPIKVSAPSIATPQRAATVNGLNGGSSTDGLPETSSFLLTADIKILDFHHFPNANTSATTTTTSIASVPATTGKGAAPINHRSSDKHGSTTAITAKANGASALQPFIAVHASSAHHNSKVPGLFVPALPSLTLAVLPPQFANARFIPSAKTLPDGTVVRPGKPVVQHWTFRNSGSKAWPVGTRLVYCHGNVHETPFPPVAIPSINPAQQVTIALTVHLPLAAVGRYWGVYRLCAAPAATDTDSCRFGDSVWLDVNCQTEQQQQTSLQATKIGIEVVTATPPVRQSQHSQPSRHDSYQQQQQQQQHNSSNYQVQQHQQLQRDRSAAAALNNSYSQFLAPFATGSELHW